MIRRLIPHTLLAVLVLAAAPAARAQAEKLGAGDAIRVTVHQQPDLSTEARKVR